MLDFSPTAADQIRFLLATAKDSTFDSVLHELCEFVSYGSEGSVLLLQMCLEQFDSRGNMQNMPMKTGLTAAVLKFLLGRPNFSTVFCEALLKKPVEDAFLEKFSKTLNLTVFEKIGISLSLADCEKTGFRIKGQSFCLAQIEELCGNPASLVSHEPIQDIFMCLSRSEELSKHIDSFTKMLYLVQQKEPLPFFLAPMLADDLSEIDPERHLKLFDGCSGNDFDAILVEIEKEVNMVDVMGELGYGCTSDCSHCKEMLSLFLPLTEGTIAKILGTIVHTRAGSEDNLNLYSTFCAALGKSANVDSFQLSSWNVDVLVDSIKQLVPDTNWTIVVEKLDYEGFYIPDGDSFSFFMSIYSTATQSAFPLHAICGSIWENAEGQLSFLRHAVSVRPEVFTFAHSERKTPSVECINSTSGYGNEAWLSLDLLDILCELAERGHANAVREILENPLRQCPDVLLLGISHCKTAYNMVQYEVLYDSFLEMLKNPKKLCLISQLWHVNSSLVLHGFMDAHRMDPGAITRIVNVCEELKLLTTVLDSTPFSFSIRLAVFASQAELIDLEKWLGENLKLYNDIFYEVCLKFLKDILPDLANDGLPVSSESTDAGGNMPRYLFDKVFKILQAHAGQLLSPQLSEELKKVSSLQVIPGSQGGASVESSPPDGSPDDVEAEANAYFHQMFSGQLKVDTMIQTLARFKEYPDDNREKKIFNCMIGNLFEEYKFFPKYPDKQLKIAAELFGSLIKHQLVTHLSLGIALRCVLDALRKSVDSKMFLFGAKALEQFTDRLMEWPQYCNHILQISHLRGTHPDLVSFIERVLARISSSQPETNSGNSISFDHHQSSSTVPLENFEMHRNQVVFDDRTKPPASSAGQMKPVISPSGLSPFTTIHGDSVGGEKVTVTQPLQTTQHPAIASSVASSSPSFLRSSRVLPPAGILRQSSYSPGFGAALNIETLVAAAERRDTLIEAPSSEIQDKIFFMINNISTSNLDSKAKEFGDILKEEYYPWFAQYMVMKRASIEPNFHDLYLKFLDKVNSRTLNKEVVKASYENCKVLLGSDLIKSSSEERSLLKNLGSWLGKFTIGRNQVLRAREIDPKSLIVEAYEKGLMIAVIPFTSKILEPCNGSLAYQPPNPWTMAILGLLVEIYNLPNLKMNLKFDIEVLFKNLCVDMKDVKPTSLLKDRVREVEGNPDFSNKDTSAQQAPVIAENNLTVAGKLNQIEMQPQVTNITHLGGHPSTLSQYPGTIHHPPGMLTEDDKLMTLGIADRLPPGQPQSSLAQSSFSGNQATGMSSISSHIVINSKLSALGLQMHLQRVIPLAVEKAVAEVITAVVTRSVTIASQTTKELVQKDYCIESDDNRVRHAANLMVCGLCGSLAHVTCKEPLRVSLSNNLRTLLQPLNVSSEVLEQTIQLITNDNLDLGCALVEQSATERALQSMEGDIAQLIAYKKKQRESTGAAYFEAATYSQGVFARVPEALRPKPGRLSSNQQRVYEEFVKYPWHNKSKQNPNVVSAPGQLTSSGGASSTQTGATEVGSQQASEINSIIPPLVSTAPELQIIEPPSKELGGVVPSSPTTTVERLGISTPETSSTVEALDKYQILAQKLENLLSKDSRDTDVQTCIQGVTSELHEILRKCVNRDEAALAIAQKVFKQLYENLSNNTYVRAHLSILIAIRDMCKLVVKELTNWVIYSDEERKYNKDIIVGLIQSDLLNIGEYDTHLAKLVDGGRNKAAMEFVVSLLQSLVVEGSGVNASEFYNAIDVLSKLALRPGAPESLQQLVEIAKKSSSSTIPPVGVAVSMEEKARQFRDKKTNVLRVATNMDDYTPFESVGPDPAGFREKVTHLFGEWYRVTELSSANEAANFTSQLQQTGLLKGDDNTDRFFRVITEFTVGHCLASEQQGQNLSFAAIDAYAQLIIATLKYASVDQGSSRFSNFPKIAAVIVKVVLKDSEEKKTSFNPRPYFRLFLNLLMDLTSPDLVLEGASIQVLNVLANAFNGLQPLKVPSFSFAWLELVSHRSFMPKLLGASNQKGWPSFQRLLVGLLKFLEPYLRNADLGEPIQFLYKGTLRMLLVLLHDFPEFLCDYHFSFCDVIPSSCIQMRNIILSAFPVNMRLPDPCTPNLKIDLLPEISQSPRILSDIDGALKARQIKADIDEYLKTKHGGPAFLTELKQRLQLPPQEVALAGTRYNVPLMNSVVLYVGMQAIQQLQSSSQQHVPAGQVTQTGPMDIFLVSAAMDIFDSLIMDLDTEGRYLFLNAVANQLRYPNNHTHYFSFVLLYLFVEANQHEIIQEQITRVLLERLIVNRPHPWGLLITFIELIKNPRYNFWSKSFIRCDPDIENLFEQVSRSCGGSRGVDDGMVAGGLSDTVH